MTDWLTDTEHKMTDWLTDIEHNITDWQTDRQILNIKWLPDWLTDTEHKMTHSLTVTEHKMTHGMTAWFNVWLPNFKMIDWQVKLSDQLILTGCVWLNIWMTDSLTNKQCVWVMEWRENQSINEPTSPKNTKKNLLFCVTIILTPHL